jgi:hypothetical protein
MSQSATRSGIRQNSFFTAIAEFASISKGLVAKSTTLCIAMILLSHPLALQAQEIELSAKADRDKLQIADPFELTIRVVAPEGTQVAFPATAERLGPFEVLNTSEKLDVPISEASGTSRLWVQNISLETLETGELEIPVIEVAVKQDGQREEIQRTKPVTINVESVVEPAADLTKFKGIADVHDVEVPADRSYSWVWLTSGALATLALAGGALFIATRRNGAVSAKAWALQKLTEAQKLPEAETIVRQFIEERFEFSATSLPEDRVAAALRVRGVDDSLLPELKEFLQKSERAKFGGLDLPTDEQNRLLNLATQLVEKLDQTGEQD